MSEVTQFLNVAIKFKRNKFERNGKQRKMLKKVCDSLRESSKSAYIGDEFTISDPRS